MEPQTPPNYSGRIKVQGLVDIHNGDYHQLGIKNHFVGNALNAVINILGDVTTTAASRYGLVYVWTTSTSYAQMVLGTDTTHITTIPFGGLVAPIGTPPGTAPSSQSGSTATLTNGAAVTYTATWNAGTVSGTVGEVGLFFSVYPVQPAAGVTAFGTAAQSASPPTGGGNFWSRLSVADGDFVAFAIITANPLTVNWTIQFTFI